MFKTLIKYKIFENYKDPTKDFGFIGKKDDFFNYLCFEFKTKYSEIYSGKEEEINE